MPHINNRVTNYRALGNQYPWLPWPLNRFAWLNRPVRAERLAAFRIGLATILLADVVITYLPNISDFYGPDRMVPSRPSGLVTDPARWNWSLLTGSWNNALVVGLATVWAFAAATLLLGFWARFSAGVAWLLAITYYNLNSDIHDGGDLIKTIGLMYLVLSPCAAVWSVDHWRRTRGRLDRHPVYVAPWPVRLLFLQLSAIYFGAGFTKMMDPSWLDGTSTYFVLTNVYWSLSSYPLTILPESMLRLLTWFVATWELCFPFLVLFPLTRPLTLLIGVLFHLTLITTMRLGPFPFYMLCLYLPLLPWERFYHLRHELARYLDLWPCTRRHRDAKAPTPIVVIKETPELR